jgi:stearoyl-CoA desaturase (delta-9 desaturase)
MHPIITSMQKRHFVFLDVLPFLGSIAAIGILARTGISRGDWVSFAVMWYVGVIGIEIGYHRYFSHSAFTTGSFGRALLAIFGSMGGQGPVVTWASTHRHHHNHSDTIEDSHSPYHRSGHPGASLRGFIHSQLTWKWQYPYPNPSLYTPHLVRDRLIATLSRYYYVWVVLGIVIPGLMSAAIDRSWHSMLTGMLFGGVLRLFLGQQVTFLINSLCHLVGWRPFDSKDNSRNVVWLIPLTLGGSLHNSHHAFPSTANNGLLWWQLDPGYWLLWGLERVGLVSDVRTIGKEAVAKRRRGARRGPVAAKAQPNDAADAADAEAAE